MRAKKLPTAKAPDAKRMGTALVMPTNDWKMLMPRTAANLHRAFRNPKAVVLKKMEKKIKNYIKWICLSMRPAFYLSIYLHYCTKVWGQYYCVMFLK